MRALFKIPTVGGHGFWEDRNYGHGKADRYGHRRRERYYRRRRGGHHRSSSEHTED